MESLPTTEKKERLGYCAINGGDFSSLAGTWRNGKGAEIVIQADGKVKGQGSLKMLQIRIRRARFLMLRWRWGDWCCDWTSENRFQNPDGDQSDTSKPRLVVTQSAGNYRLINISTVNKKRRLNHGLSSTISGRVLEQALLPMKWRKPLKRLVGNSIPLPIVPMTRGSSLKIRDRKGL